MIIDREDTVENLQRVLCYMKEHPEERGCRKQKNYKVGTVMRQFIIRISLKCLMR